MLRTRYIMRLGGQCYWFK